ncbi:hypothetical protein Hanom_Chr15g01398691 [Helianthus anomalus]
MAKDIVDVKISWRNRLMILRLLMCLNSSSYKFDFSIGDPDHPYFTGNETRFRVVTGTFSAKLLRVELLFVMLVVFLSESGLDTISRTGLDMLAKHYTDAVGFDIVFFLPDSEEDFASYTEFVRYLGDRNQAGVAKFDDGTTLFLVPPSEFLSEVLNVSGPERLYGVVLKFPQHASASSSQPQFIDKQQVPSQNEYNVVPSGEKVLQVDYSGVPHDDLKSNPKSTGPSHNTLAPPPPSPAVSARTPQTGLLL